MNAAAQIDDDDDDDDELYDPEDFLGDEDWEDPVGMERIKAARQIPETWHLVKVVNFDWRMLDEIDEWCQEHCRGEYKRIGWSSDCSTKVAVCFVDHLDAIYFKLRWR